MTQQAGGMPDGARVVVFYAGSEAVGQTTAVFSTAVVMAGAGRRVLVVHVPGADSRAEDHLRHRAGGTRVPSADAGAPARAAAEALVPPAGGEGPVDGGPLPVAEVWRLPAGDRSVRLSVLGLPDAAALARLPARGEAAGSALYAGHDTVLVDAPAPRTPEQALALARLGHVLAACFAPTSWSVDAAAALAREMVRGSRAGEGPRDAAGGSTGGQAATGPAASGLVATGPAGSGVAATGPAASRPAASDPAASDPAPAFDVVAVGIQADNRLSEQLRLARDRVRAAFRGLTGERAVPYVEIPFDPLDAQDAVVGRDGAGSPAGQDPRPPQNAVRRSGYARLAEVLDRPVSRGVERVTLVGPERSRAWTEWLEDQVRGAGVACSTVPLEDFSGEAPAPGAMVLVVAPTGTVREQSAPLERLSHPDVRVVLADDEPLPPRLGHHEQLDLRHCPPADAAARLRHALRLPPAPAPVGTVPFPVLPERHNLPPRDPGFTGHDGLLRALREHFAAAAGQRPVRDLVTGPSGIGKSALAREFCHRFAGTYEIVWWLNAADRGGIERGLGLLAGSLGLPERADEPREVLAWLESPDAPRWLLVYDDADDPAALEGLLPGAGDGHVLLTCRAGELPGATAVAVPPLSAGESRELLAVAVPGLEPALADQVGQAMGRGPLAVSLAGAWIGLEAERRMAGLNRRRAGALRDAADRLMTAFAAHQQRLLARGEPVPLERVMLEAAVADLQFTAGGELWAREPGGTAALEWLLECCALLTPVGMDAALLRTPALVAALTARAAPEERGAGAGGPAASLSDPLVIDAAVWALVRQGLLDLHTAAPGGGQAVRQVRPLRDMVLARMEPAERDRREWEVRGILAGAMANGGRGGSGGGAGGPAGLDARTRRLTGLRMWADERPEVRQVVLGQIAGLIATGERRHLTEALAVAGRTARAWSTRPLALEYLRLLNYTAQAHRLLGRYTEAAATAEEALRGHRTVLGLHHPRSLLSADSFGAVLRSQGAMTEARIVGRHVRGTMAGVLGPDHPATAQTEHNLALAEALCGNYRAAYDLLQGRWDVLVAAGRTDLSLMDILAFVHRGLGRDRESFDLLKLYLHHARGATDTGSVNAEIGLAVSERRLGLAAHGRQPGLIESALERDQRILEECRRRFGDGQLVTERCRFSLAADLHAVHKHGEALHEIRACRRALEDSLGEDHPYAVLALVREGVHLRATDETGAALDTGTRALDALRDCLGRSHPWVAAAAVAVAGTLLALGQPEPARQKYQEALETLDDLGQGRHPDRALAARGLHALGPAGGGRPPGPGGAGAERHQDVDLELPGL